MVSIHAPRVGSDLKPLKDKLVELMFQSTPPVWGATYLLQYVPEAIKVSIHAPRVGSDTYRLLMRPLIRCFNPRPPCGERHDSHHP